ncbi:MAG: hypothetical protein NVSMB13_20720 [Mycobacteriales bacterium]
MPSLSAVLTGAGLRVSEPAFARLVADALRELGPAGADEPRSGLSRREADVLTAVGADLSPRGALEPDPRAEAAAAFAALLARSHSVADVARALGVDTSRVRHRLAARQLIGVRRPTGWALPAYQFGVDGQPLAGLGVVAAALPADAHPVAVARWFATPTPELAMSGRSLSPRDWLAGGGAPAAAARLAAGLDQLP